MAKHWSDQNHTGTEGGTPSSGLTTEQASKLDKAIISDTITRIERVTQVQYDALSSAQKNDATVIYAISSITG